MSKGLYTGTAMVGVDQIVFGGKAPWTLHHNHADNETLKKKNGGATYRLPQARRHSHLSTACPRFSSRTPIIAKISQRI
jgi:hypothetical protein